MHTIAAIMWFFDDSSNAMNAAAVGGFMAAYGLFVLILVAFEIFLMWKIATKAGYPGAYSLLMLIPLVNIIIFIMFAFTEWPIERDLKALRGTRGTTLTS